MANPDAPPPHPPRDPDAQPDASHEPPPAAEDLQARVQRQRRHIEEATGRDPLRGGVDD